MRSCFDVMVCLPGRSSAAGPMATYTSKVTLIMPNTTLMDTVVDLGGDRLLQEQYSGILIDKRDQMEYVVEV